MDPKKIVTSILLIRYQTISELVNSFLKEEIINKYYSYLLLLHIFYISLWVKFAALPPHKILHQWPDNVGLPSKGMARVFAITFSYF